MHLYGKNSKRVKYKTFWSKVGVYSYGSSNRKFCFNPGRTNCYGNCSPTINNYKAGQNIWSYSLQTLDNKWCTTVTPERRGKRRRAIPFHRLLPRGHFQAAAQIWGCKESLVAWVKEKDESLGEPEAAETAGQCSRETRATQRKSPRNLHGDPLESLTEYQSAGLAKALGDKNSFWGKDHDWGAVNRTIPSAQTGSRMVQLPSPQNGDSLLNTWVSSGDRKRPTSSS